MNYSSLCGFATDLVAHEKAFSHPYCSIFSRKTPSTTISKDIELVTDPTRTEEDWGLIFSICQEVNRTELGGKEARKALQKKLNSNSPATQIHVFTVLKALTENSEQKFRDQIVAKSFLKDLEKLVTTSSIDPQVYDLSIQCITMWATYYQNLKEMLPIVILYNRIVPKISTTRNSPIVRPNLLSHGSQHSLESGLQMQQSQVQEQLRQAAMQASINNYQNTIVSDIELCHSNVNLLSEMLSFTDPSQEDISKNELIVEFYDKCKKSQLIIARHMQQCGDPDTLATLLSCHKEVKKVFNTYNDMLEHGYYTQARAASQQVSHRGTGDSNLIELEANGDGSSDSGMNNDHGLAAGSSNGHANVPTFQLEEDPFVDQDKEDECDIPILQTKSTKALGKQKIADYPAMAAPATTGESY